MPAQKRRRVTRDSSDEYAKNLASTSPAVLNTTDDLRRELSAPLPGTIFVCVRHASLLSNGAHILPLEENECGTEEVMEGIEGIVVYAWLLDVRDGTEEVWASTADRLTGLGEHG